MRSILLPRHLHASRFRFVWYALLALAPLAYAVSVDLQYRTDHNLHVGFQLDRETAFQAARTFAAQKGIEASTWTGLATVDTDNNLHFYRRLRRAEGPAADDPVWEQIGIVTVKTLLTSPDSTQKIEVFLTPAGRPTGFRHVFADSTSNAAPLPEAATRALATAALCGRDEIRWVPQLAPTRMEEDTEAKEVRRHYTWDWQLPQLPALQVSTTISVRGQTVVGERTRARLLPAEETRLFGQQRRQRVIGGIIYGLSFAIIFLLGIYRFVKRAQQKELSYQRIIIVSLGIGFLLTSFILFTDTAVYDVAVRTRDTAPQWFIYLSSSIAFLLMGMLFGLAYGAGEGDIREAYPGKLTSLDALITGRIFSQNVGRSILWGSVLGSWLLLVSGISDMLWSRLPQAGDEFLPLVVFLAVTPFLVNLLVWQSGVILALAMSLLLPLPFLHRQIKWEKLRWGLLIFFAWIAFAEPTTNYRPWLAVLLFALVRASLMLLAFFKFDLLTAATVIAVPVFSKFAWALFAQPAPTLKRDGALCLLVLFALVATAFFFALRGRRYRDEDVRPLYARHLAERLSLTAEVSAARLAQERLLPQAVPQLPGLTLAAVCVPAHEVGGDFYDFFPLPDGRLGVLVAEGGGQGLGAALTIAYAKGFLMSHLNISNQAKAQSTDQSPTEVFRALQQHLAPVLQLGERVGLTYAEFDVDDGEFRYARTGGFPRFCLQRSATNASAATEFEETELTITTRPPTSAGSETPLVTRITAGRATLQPGDAVGIYTGGVAEDWAQQNLTPQEVLDSLLQQKTPTRRRRRKTLSGLPDGVFHATPADEQAAPGKAQAQLQTALEQQLREQAKRSRKRERSDDLTAVVLHYQMLVNGAASNDGAAIDLLDDTALQERGASATTENHATTPRPTVLTNPEGRNAS